MSRQRGTPGIELHRLAVPDRGRLPFAVGTFDTIGPLSRAGFPHRHSFYELAYVTGGRGSHVLDLADQPLRPPQLCAIVPGQVHHWARAAGLDGWVLLFEEDFLLRHPEDAALARELAGAPPLRPDRAEARRLAGLLADLDGEYRTAGAGHPGVLQALLHVLLVRAVRALPDRPRQAPPAAESAAARPHPLVDRFGRLVAEPGRADRSVGSYARELGVSTGRLHELVREATGRTPARLIRQQQTLEAKRLLSATDLTVRQVAAAAGFADPAYFCRFFRREVGLTPGEFRAGTGGGKHHGPGAESIDPRTARP
ncbi:helix-turn-helix domain-containing protein [Kitasatospora sp. NPDC085895]|uniref:helix-turn-helix domain-containing protein n=1 Tax=Kitasatospora sp. NPDC085895 TaxID=3155057 RepID=UPI00344F0F8F